MKKIPYATQWIDDDDIKAVGEALRSSNLTQGPLVEEFENKIAQYCGTNYAVAVNSGTSALHLACRAAGIGQDDEVLTTANTFVASANCILYCGGKPVFADIQSDTANIDCNEIRKKITKKTRAIIPVHFAGHPCDMVAIGWLAKEHGLMVIEDAAHALGAKYKVPNDGSSDWTKVGSCKHSDMTILSFHPVKHITTGEGGMVLTNDPDLYKKLVFFRSHGITRNPKHMKKIHGIWYYEMHELGYNYRLTDIQSALGISQLAKIEEFVQKRRQIAEKYDQAFSGIKGIELLKEQNNSFSSRHLYIIQVENRDLVFNWLREEANILVNVHYLPVYLHPYYAKMGYLPGQCPLAEKYYSRAISIPMYPKLLDREVEFVINRVKRAVSK